MLHFTKKFIDKNFLLLTYIGVIFCFIPLFYFSTKFMINNWAYADALINYSEGFIRRGFLGEILLFIYKVTNFELSKIYSYFFIITTFSNITFFILLLKNISKSRFVYLFLLIHLALLFFPLNDSLGYMRKDMIMLTLMLFHCYICSNYHKDNIDKKKYLKFLYIIIIPGIVINTLMHDMQVFLIPFHFLLSVNILNKNLKLFNPKNYFEKINLTLTPYLITFLPIIIFQFYPTDIEKLKIIAEKLSVVEPNLWWNPIRFTATPFFTAVIIESKFMFSADKMGTYNHLFQNSFLLFLSLTSIIFIFKVILKKNINIFNNHFLYFSILPIFLLFFIGKDWGRWINMISWACLLFYLQFNINIKNSYFFIFKKNFLLNIMIVSFSCYYSFFLFLPHCCKGQTIFGGLSSNVVLAYEVIFKDSSHLKDTFRKH
tara:strand:- start:294 stop:1583 length:1290 start_codon:yes stop_codon:yes gene_type:complete